MKRRELEKRLTDLGWRLDRHGARHDVWRGGERTDAMPRHTEINDRLAKAILAERNARADAMRFRGMLHRDGKHWLAEVPVFDAMTQGRTRGEALDMIADWFASMAGRSRRAVRIVNVRGAEFEIAAIDTRPMISLLLRRQRQKSGLSLAAVAERLGAKSRNAYARYEQGTTVPTVEKLAELLHAIAPDCEILVDLSEAA